MEAVAEAFAARVVEAVAEAIAARVVEVVAEAIAAGVVGKNHTDIAPHPPDFHPNPSINNFPGGFHPTRFTNPDPLVPRPPLDPPILHFGHKISAEEETIRRSPDGMPPKIHVEH